MAMGSACQDEDFIAKVNNLAEGSLRAAYQIRSKQARVLKPVAKPMQPSRPR